MKKSSAKDEKVGENYEKS